MDQSSAASVKSGGHDRVHSLSNLNPINNNSSINANSNNNNNNDTDSVNGPVNDKTEMDGAHIENDAKSISSNKSVGSAQDR